jgi:hypothetical protein
MWHLIVTFWLTDHTFGKAEGGNFPTWKLCAAVGRDFLEHYPHTVKFECHQ